MGRNIQVGSIGRYWRQLRSNYAGCSDGRHFIGKCNKGTQWMPWLSRKKKDVISCEKVWGFANKS